MGSICLSYAWILCFLSSNSCRQGTACIPFAGICCSAPKWAWGRDTQRLLTLAHWASPTLGNSISVFPYLWHIPVPTRREQIPLRPPKTWKTERNQHQSEGWVITRQNLDQDPDVAWNTELGLVRTLTRRLHQKQELRDFILKDSSVQVYWPSDAVISCLKQQFTWLIDWKQLVTSIPFFEESTGWALSGNMHWFLVK